eukprot:TRINITY_DN2256_c0_g1_i1.p1 TRINITY_DN2256_c0_g1~~TRINITY_DN2256_c0_g1_i1.p1  ORF type:complete len:503 (-),score=103.46 TRINITY_DN2256_c0_g1_i1:79-1371(-)
MVIDKFAISSKVKELATYIATAIRKKRAALTVSTINEANNTNKNEDINRVVTSTTSTITTTTTTSNATPPTYLTRPTPPGLVSAASILLAAQLEGVPLKSMSEICSSTGLSEEVLQTYYKELVGHVAQLLPPNYVPSSKVWIYLRSGIDQGYIPSPLLSPISHSVAASPSLSLSPLSLTRHAHNIPDMAAIQMDSASKDKNSLVKDSSTPNMPSTPKLNIGQPYLMMPPSPLFVPRRGSVQVINALADKSLDPNSMSRRASLGPATPTSPSMKKIAVQIDSNNFPPDLNLNSWKSSPNSDSAIAAAAVIASLSSTTVDIDNDRKTTESKHAILTPTLSSTQHPHDLPFRKFTRRYSSQSTSAIQLPPPVISSERRSSLGRRGSTIANEDYTMSSKRSKMGINQLLNSSSSSSSTSLPISPIREDSDSSDC